MLRRPTILTLVVFGVVFALQWVAGLAGVGTAAFALALPLSDRPWTVLLSVYAHGSVWHLAANSLALVLVGPIVGYVSTPVRFHAFFVISGAAAGVTQVLVTAPVGSTAVLGASGAVFALFGYLVVANPAAEVALSWLPVGRRGRIALIAVLAVAVTLATAAPGVAVVAHFAGFLFGGIAGRFRLLHRR